MYSGIKKIKIRRSKLNKRLVKGGNILEKNEDLS